MGMISKHTLPTPIIPLLLACGALSSSPVMSQTLRFDNAQDISIPIEQRHVRLDSSGNVLTQCSLVNEQCPILSAPSSAAPPTQVVLSSPATTVPAGTTVGMSWFSTGATVCRGVGSPWDGLPLTTYGTHPLHFPLAGSYPLQVACYTPGGERLSSALTITAVPPTASSPEIPIFAAHPTTGPVPLQTTLSWTSSNVTACQGQVTGPDVVPAWASSKPVVGSQSLSLTAQGTYRLDLVCTNATGVQVTKSVNVVVTSAGTPPPPPGGGDYCQEYYDGSPALPTDPKFYGNGMAKVEVPFETIFGIQAGDSRSTLVGVPAEHLNPAMNRYLAIPFVMNAGDTSLSGMILQWIDGNSHAGVYPGAILMTVSPCPGDFRAPVGISNPDDRYLGAVCRISGPESLSNGLTLTADPQYSGCYIPSGRKGYINIAPHAVYGSSIPMKYLCGNYPFCGVGMIVR